MNLRNEAEIMKCWTPNSKTLVTIVCITYNQEKYIEDAIKGFLIQETKFPFEIIIHDDASTDNTPKIIQQYEKQYLKVIRPIYQTENQYSKKISLWADLTFPLALGKYIAICEGDDYWTDPFKLQKQVDFLEENHDVIMTFGNALIQDYTGEYHKQGLYIKGTSPNLYTPDMVINLGLPTLSMTFRNNIKLPEWYGNIKSGDYFLRLILSKYGNFYYHDEVFGVHRKHASGISRTRDRLDWNLNTAKNLKNFCQISYDIQKNQILKKIVVHEIHAFYWSIKSKKLNNSIKLFLNILVSKGFYSRKGIGTFKKLFKEVVINKNYKSLDIF